MNKVIITTKVGALPYGADKNNQLVLDSKLRVHPRERNDEADGKAIADWLSRFVPYQLYQSILKNMSER